MSSGQGGLLRAFSVAHSSVSVAEAPCGCSCFGVGLAEERSGRPRAGLQAAQEVAGGPRWARSRLAGPLRRLGPGAAQGPVEAVDP